MKPFGISIVLFSLSLIFRFCSSAAPYSKPDTGTAEALANGNVTSLIRDFIESSLPLSESFHSNLSPNFKDGFKRAFESFGDLLGFEEEDEEMATIFLDAIEPVLDSLSHEILIEAAANSLEYLLRSNNRLTPEDDSRILGALATTLEEGRKSLDQQDDAWAHGQILCESIFHFLNEQRLGSMEHLLSLAYKFVSELYALTGNDQ